MTTQTMYRRMPVPDRATSALLDRIGADPPAPMLVGIVAPGGYGKTTTLAALERVYRHAGVEVANWPPPGRDATGMRPAPHDATGTRPVSRDATGPRPVDHDGVLLVDDVHRLGDAALRELLRIAGTPGQRLAVAYRPWPRPAPLAELTALLRRHGQLVMPSPFGPEQIGDLLAAAGIAPTERLVELLRVQTGGVPALLDQAIDALRESGAGAGTGAEELPDAAVAGLRHDLDLLDRDVQFYLIAAEAGAGLDADLLGGLLGRDTEGIAEIVAAARATGLVGRDGAPVPMVRRAVAALVPVECRIGVRRRLAELQLKRGGSVLGVARSLLGTGIAGPDVAAAFEAAADEALPREPALSAQFYAAGVAAGRPAGAVATRWAQAAALAGDLDSALRMADQVLATENAVDRADGARVAAAALAHRGQLAHSAQLYRWSGAGWPAAFAAIGLIGTGQLADARQLLDAATAADPPTLLAGAAALMAQGVHESVTGTATAALAALVRAADLLQPAGAALLPDSPAALAALVALHGGDLTLAESVLERAVAARLGGRLLSVRHRLLQAWTLMVRGETGPARELLTAATRHTGTLEPRDWLFRVALDVGLARRDSDLATLRRTWADACEAVLRHPVDLFSLLPLGELAICAARLGDHERMAPHLAEAHALLERLECWLAVLAGAVDAERVDAAARGLHAVGLRWDGARLAAQAAIRTSDRGAMVALLDCARTLQGRPATGRSPAPGRPPAASSGAAVRAGLSSAEAIPLSEREQEVAALVVAGLTYRQIGSRLFISPKTIEHHVARMRQRLGCESRADLLARLRELVADPRETPS
ncbi:MAG: hypothetical protein AUI14_24045 [Actinobacteria bacterium 13_2_20CM_2_71_6]|nr:MAG: hypothetical protein AUI14_24045 [Actinobacteria bacterium 13_2_20CM_2_71_6]